MYTTYNNSIHAKCKWALVIFIHILNITITPLTQIFCHFSVITLASFFRHDLRQSFIIATENKRVKGVNNVNSWGARINICWKSRKNILDKLCVENYLKFLGFFFLAWAIVEPNMKLYIQYGLLDFVCHYILI